MAYRKGGDGPRAKPEGGIVEEVVQQFADKFAFTRELVQNSIDAGATRIDVAFHESHDRLDVVFADDGAGMTFEVIQGPLVTAPLLSKRLPYDPVRELAPVSLVATSPNVLVVDPRLGVDTLADFVRVAKQKRGAWNYGSVGNGSASHLAMEWFRTRTGLELVHVPYAGFPQVVNAILAGQVQAAFMVPGLAMAQVKAGKLRALGVTSLGRVASLPDLPALAELGHPGFEAISWQAVLAPAGTPAPMVERMSREVIRIVKGNDFRTKLLGQYFTAAGTTPEALRGLMVSERERWSKVIRVAGVLPE